VSKINSLQVGSLWLNLQIHQGNKSLTGLNRLFPIIVADTELFSYLADPDLLLAILHISRSLTHYGGLLRDICPKGTPTLTVHHKISH